MTQDTELDGLDRVPIAQLDASAQTLSGAVEGVVTLIWPYSNSKQSFSILLAEPDFRLRRHKGQVRIHFTGPSAKAAARHNVQSGDKIVLNLLGAQWEKDETTSSTPGRGVEWELHYAGRVVLRIQREGQAPIILDIDHPVQSPEARIRSPPPYDSGSIPQFPSTPIPFPAVPALRQAWSTPAFLKRDRLSAASFFGSDYDPFDEDEFKDNNRRKKTKFGRNSDQWRFTEKSSSPESVAQVRMQADNHPAAEEASDLHANGHADVIEPSEYTESKEVATDMINHDFTIEGQTGDVLMRENSPAPSQVSNVDLAQKEPVESSPPMENLDTFTTEDRPPLHSIHVEPSVPQPQQEDTSYQHDPSSAVITDSSETPEEPRKHTFDEQSLPINAEPPHSQRTIGNVTNLEEFVDQLQSDTLGLSPPSTARDMESIAHVPQSLLDPGQTIEIQSYEQLPLDVEEPAKDSPPSKIMESDPHVPNFEHTEGSGAVTYPSLRPNEETVNKSPSLELQEKPAAAELRHTEANPSSAKIEGVSSKESGEDSLSYVVSHHRSSDAGEVEQLLNASSPPLAVEDGHTALTTEATQISGQDDELDIHIDTRTVNLSVGEKNLPAITTGHEPEEALKLDLTGVAPGVSIISDAVIGTHQEDVDVTPNIRYSEIQMIDDQEALSAPQGYYFQNTSTSNRPIGLEENDQTQVRDATQTSQYLQASRADSSSIPLPDTEFGPQGDEASDQILDPMDSAVDAQAGYPLSSDEFDVEDSEEEPPKRSRDSYSLGWPSSSTDDIFDAREIIMGTSRYSSLNTTNSREPSTVRNTPTSNVPVISIDDSDDDGADVGQSQTDGAAISAMRNIRQERQPSYPLSPIKHQNSLELPSQRLPDTVPDSQATAEAPQSELSAQGVMLPTDEVESISSAESDQVEDDDVELNSSHVSPASPSPELGIPSEDIGSPQRISFDKVQAQATQETYKYQYIIELEDSHSPSDHDMEPRAMLPLQSTLIDPHLDPRLKNEVLTPNETQQRDELSQESGISLRSIHDTHDLPTPQLTQNRSSDLMLPASLRSPSPAIGSSPPLIPSVKSSPPVIDRKPDLVDQLQRLRTEDRRSPRSSPRSRRVSNIPASVSPWFAPKRTNDTVPDSRSPSDDGTEEVDFSPGEDDADIEDANIEEEEDEEDEEIPSSNVNTDAQDRGGVRELHTALDAAAETQKKMVKCRDRIRKAWGIELEGFLVGSPTTTTEGLGRSSSEILAAIAEEVPLSQAESVFMDVVKDRISPGGTQVGRSRKQKLTRADMLEAKTRLNKRSAQSPTSKPLHQGISVQIERTPPAAPSSPPLGLRTSHGYYAPLSALLSHFGSHISTLSIVLTSTPIARATSGPLDFYTTVLLIDPSSLASYPPRKKTSPTSTTVPSPFTIAQIFRPSRASLPSPCLPGSIILLRSFTIRSTNHTPSLLSTDSSAWVLFAPQEPNPRIPGPPVEFGAEERGYVRGLGQTLGVVEQAGEAVEIEARQPLAQGRHDRGVAGLPELGLEAAHVADGAEAAQLGKVGRRQRRGRGRRRGRSRLRRALDP
ncbi:MAG: hypothetical protein Q9218_006081, partial [Villophora microphyllina]